MDKVNMLRESASFSDWATLVNTPGMGALIAGMVIEERQKVSMFTNVPGLINSSFKLEAGAGDEVKIYQMSAAKGVGLPGEYQSDRQLAGNEASFDFNMAYDKVTIGMHRYAIALRNFTDKEFLPKQMINYILSSISSWWTEQSDADVFTTLFRDYPVYYAETETVSAGLIERVEALFGRGTRNNINAEPAVIMPNGKTDIENATATTGLRDTDTLSDVFLRKLNSFCQNIIGMDPIAMEDSLANYGLIVDQSDINFLRANSSSTLEDKIKTAFQGQGWNSPIFKNVIMDLEGIRLFKWDPIASNDSKNALSPANSQYKGLRGTALYPMGRILAAAKDGDTVSGLKVWGGGDIAGTRGIPTGTAKNYYLLVSNGAKNFPYFSPGGSATIGKESLNKFAVTATEAALASCSLAAGKYAGRLQIGEGTTALTRFKVLYTGPIYVGSLKVGTPFGGNRSFVEDVYKLKVEAIATWDNTTGKFNDYASLNTDMDGPTVPAAGGTPESGAGTDTYWDALLAFLGIDSTTNVINQAASYNNFTYLKNQRIHMFDVVRSIVFGRNILNEAIGGNGLNYATETRDYGAVTGNALTAMIGRKVATNVQGLVTSYAIVAFKRPNNLL